MSLEFLPDRRPGLEIDDLPYVHGPKDSDYTPEQWAEIEKAVAEEDAKPKVIFDYGKD